MSYIRQSSLTSIYENNSSQNGSIQNIVIPNVETKDEKGNTRVKDIFSTLNDNRIIMVDGEVNDLMAAVVCGQLLQLDNANPNKEIYMYINSPGGSVTAGMAIFDTMMNVQAPVITVGLGMCASMGAFLLAAGNLRNGATALPNTEIMIHQRATRLYA